MGLDPVPGDTARAVAFFVWARAHDPLPPDATAEKMDQLWVDRGLVRDFQRAVDHDHAVTADNLAYTLLIAAARHRHHPDFQDSWLAWTPFEDVAPGSTADGPAAAEQEHDARG
jgi:hypothetical protein